MLYSGGDFTKEEFIDFLLIQNNIDKQLAELYLYPRWNRYKFTLLRFASKNHPKTEQTELEIGVVLQLIVGEAIVKSALKRIHRRAIDNSEAAKDLKFHYEEVKGFLEKCQNNSFGFSPSVRNIYLKELPAYEQLLEELAMSIRKANSNSLLKVEEGNKQLSAGDGIETEVASPRSASEPDELQNSVSNPEEKTVRIKFSEEAQVELKKLLLPHVEQKSEQSLLELLAGKEIAERVVFKGSLSQLTDIFKDLKDRKLHEYKSAVDVGRWLAAYFIFYNQLDKKYVNVKEASATRSLREKQGSHRFLK